MASPKVHLPSPTELEFWSSAELSLLTEDSSPMPGPMDLLLDGYISHTLTPQCAEKYVKLFIKCLRKKPDASLVARDAEWVVLCSKKAQLAHQLQHRLQDLQDQQQQQQQSKQKRIPGSRHLNGPPRSPPPRMLPSQIKHLDDAHPHRTCEDVFDYKVDLYRGTIVPQATQMGVNTYTGVQCPFFFIQCDGTLGIPYTQREEARTLLRDPMSLAPETFRRDNQNLRVRIQWPGYKVFLYEFRIMDRKLGEQVHIPMYRVVERVARGLHRLYLEGELDPDTFSERWKFGDRDDGGIHPDEINIIGLLHISQGSWMPILQLNRHIIPRCDFFGEKMRYGNKDVLREDPSWESASDYSSPLTPISDSDVDDER